MSKNVERGKIESRAELYWDFLCIIHNVFPINSFKLFLSSRKQHKHITCIMLKENFILKVSKNTETDLVNKVPFSFYKAIINQVNRIERNNWSEQWKNPWQTDHMQLNLQRTQMNKHVKKVCFNQVLNSIYVKVTLTKSIQINRPDWVQKFSEYTITSCLIFYMIQYPS